MRHCKVDSFFFLSKFGVGKGKCGRGDLQYGESNSRQQGESSSNQSTKLLRFLVK